jgi:uncharacterized membrane protein YgcG
MDIGDIMTIVIPVDVKHSPRIRSTTYNVFKDYPQLTPEAVALSSCWYKWYAKSNPWIGENFVLTLDCIRNNTEEDLFAKCIEEMTNGYPVDAHGGPLMLMLILRRIQSSSESTITSLIKQIEHLKISKIKGENVDEAVTLIRSAYDFMIACSNEHHSYVPDGFPKTVLRVFQTTSVDLFNQTFKEEENKAEVESYKHGGTIKYPSVEESLNLATNMYSNMRPIWTGTTGTSAYNTTPSTPSSYKRTCDNCGSEDHILPDCPKERDEAAIAANRQRRLSRFSRGGGRGGRGRGGRGGGRSRGGRGAHCTRERKRLTTGEGIHLIQNKHGHFVPDTKRNREAQTALEAQAHQQAFTAAVRENMSAVLREAQSQSQPTPTEPSVPGAASTITSSDSSNRVASALEFLSSTIN